MKLSIFICLLETKLFRNFIQLWTTHIANLGASATQPQYTAPVALFKKGCYVWFGCSISISKGAFISACTNLLKRLLSFSPNQPAGASPTIRCDE